MDIKGKWSFEPWGKCELIADEGMLKSKVTKFYSQQKNNNKF